MVPSTGLAGSGQPLRLDSDDGVPPEWWAAFHSLCNDGLAPEWIERRRAIEAALAAARAAGWGAMAGARASGLRSSRSTARSMSSIWRRRT